LVLLHPPMYYCIIFYSFKELKTDNYSAIIMKTNINDLHSIKPPKTRLHGSRANWDVAFKKMADLKDDDLLIPDDLENNWDKDEWLSF